MKQTQKTILTAILVAMIGLSIAGCCNCTKLTCNQVADQLAVSTNKALQPISRPDAWWKERHAAVNERVKQGDVGLLFLGDSITHGWDNFPQLWESYFGKWNPVNAGFSGDQTGHVLWRLEHGNIDGINPKVAVLMIGTNNSNGSDYTAEEIAEGIEAIVCTLRTELPDTKLLMLAIFPRSSSIQKYDKTQNATFNPQWAKNDKASQLASQLADGKMIYYLNINDALLDDKGVLTREVMPDLLHPNEKGYQLWNEAMAPTLEKLMAGYKQ